MGIIGNVKEEIRLIRERDPAIHSSMEVFLYPSFRAEKASLSTTETALSLEKPQRSAIM